MHIQASVLRNIEQSLRQNLAIGGYDEHVWLKSFNPGDCMRFSESFRLKNGNAGFICEDFSCRRSVLSAAAGGSVGLAD